MGRTPSRSPMNGSNSINDTSGAPSYDQSFTSNDSAARSMGDSTYLLSQEIRASTKAWESPLHLHERQNETDYQLEGGLINPLANQRRVFWIVATTMTFFLGYGVMMKLQSHLRSHLHISTEKHPKDGKLASDSPSAYLFGFCVSCYYLGTMLFRMGHNIFLGYKLELIPRQRTMFGYAVMGSVVSIVCILFYGIFPDESVGLTTTPEAVAKNHSLMVIILVLYFLTGVAVASFEPNILSTLTPLGNKNKSLAAVGIPFGTNSVTMVALFLLGNFKAQAANIEAGSYIFAGVACVVGAIIYSYKVPQVDYDASFDDAKQFIANLKEWREWVPLMKIPILVGVLDEVCLAMSVAIGQYIYGNAELPLLYPFVAKDAKNQYHVPHDHFLVFYFFGGFLGAVFARHFTFHWTRRNPAVFLILTYSGIALVLSKIPLLAPIGMFLVMYGNGAIYATNVRYIDEEVPQRYNLVAISLWMCCADIGGFCGANAVVPIHASLGSV